MVITITLMLNIMIASNAAGIQVYHTSADTGNEINNGGSFDFGTHSGGSDVTRTFYIEKINPASFMSVTPAGSSFPSLPTGFSSPFPTEIFWTNTNIMAFPIDFKVKLNTSTSPATFENEYLEFYYKDLMGGTTTLYRFELRGTVTSPDDAPSVSSTTPADSATDIAIDANIAISFSEDVSIATGWFTITGSRSGSHTATVSGGLQDYTLDPDSDFWYAETVTVTLDKTKITDSDSTDPPDEMAADDIRSFGIACSPAIEVTSSDDDGEGTLRDALIGICDSGTITFDAGLADTSITLTSNELTINKDVTINNTDAANLTISGNSAFRVFHINSGKTVQIKGLTIANGSVSDHGGGINNEGDLTLTNCTLYDNEVNGSLKLGGGIHNSGTATITNCTFSGNRANSGSGGAIYNEGTVTVTNCTLYNNHGASGGGITTTGTATVQNSIIAGNTADTLFPDVAGTFISNDHNLLSETGTGFESDLIEADINKVIETTLKNNGGLTKTYALIQSPDMSPAVDAGNNSDAPGTDQRGESRPIDGDRIGSATADIGAFEAPIPLAVSINNSASANEGDGTMNFTVNCSSASDGTVKVYYTMSSGTAVSGDYTPRTSSLTIPDGDSSGIIAVNIADDALDEDNETFTVELTGADNATLGNTLSTGTIIDNDTAALSINDVTITEGNSGTANATFTVSLSPRSTKTVTVNCSTANSTAAAGTDYEATSGSLEFTAGQTSKTFTVPIIGEIMDEDEETFVVNLSGPSGGAIIETAQGICTITDNDSPPSLSIDDITVTEGNSGTVNAAFTVTLSTASSKSVTVDYETADNTAISGTDYTTAGPGTLAFSPGETTKTVNISVNGDIMDEDSESFHVSLSNPANATIADGQGIGTITTDDAPPALSIDDVTMTEGNEGTVSATFTISLSTASSRTVTVNCQTADVTAIGGIDYDVITASPLTFEPGDVTKTVEIIVSGDTADEHDETFYVNLTDASNATLADFQGIGTITNDDSDPEISVDDVTVTEGDTGTVSAIFTVSLSSPSSKMVSVDYQTADNTAIGGTDYTPLEPDTLTFNPGDTLRTVHVVVNSDTLGESDETFHVNLSNPVNAVIAGGQGIGKITDDDIADCTISVNNVTVSHDDTSVIFTVTLSAVNESEVSVAYTTNNGTAKAGKDYTADSGTLTIPAGSSSTTVTIELIANDTRSVNGSFFTLDLNDPDNATLRDNQGVGRITGKIGPGDVNGDGKVDIEDAILALQILAGIESETVYSDADVDVDGKIGIAELIFILQTASNTI